MSEEKQKIINEEHLKLLSLFYYISGAITCLFSLLPLFHVLMGIGLIQISKYAKDLEAPPQVIGWLFIIIGSATIILGLTFGILKIYTGTCIKKRKHRIFCLTISAINCPLIPYETILGILSIIVLIRPAVKSLFNKPYT